MDARSRERVPMNPLTSLSALQLATRASVAAALALAIAQSIAMIGILTALGVSLVPKLLPLRGPR